MYLRRRANSHDLELNRRRNLSLSNCTILYYELNSAKELVSGAVAHENPLFSRNVCRAIQFQPKTSVNLETALLIPSDITSCKATAFTIPSSITSLSCRSPKGVGKLESQTEALYTPLRVESHPECDLCRQAIAIQKPIYLASSPIIDATAFSISAAIQGEEIANKKSISIQVTEKSFSIFFNQQVSFFYVGFIQQKKKKKNDRRSCWAPCLCAR